MADHEEAVMSESEERIPAAPVDLAAVERYLARARDLREALGIPASAAIDARILAAGEHNMNFVFAHPSTGERFVLRVGCANQVELESPSRYEFDALRILLPSGRTPKPYWMDDGPEAPGRGVIVMEFLEGRPLDYRRPGDMHEAARILSDIHSVPAPEGSRLMALPVDPRDCAHIQSTEATADQFLVEDGEPGFMIDWEKPIVGEVAQDVAYFLAPTSTIWQDGPILTPAECERFVSDYWNAVDGRFPRGGFDARFAAFSMTNNLRGVTWSCQAWVDYHDPDRPLKHDATFRRLGRYLSEEFLDHLDKHVLSQ